jgi:hypothetical protein
MYLELVRLSDNGVQTAGTMTLRDTRGKILLEFDTLELSYKENKRQISCIPTGTYIVEPHYSFRFGRCFELQNVPERSNILIHKGNFNKDTKGCILIGNGVRDINNDYQSDVLNSAIAMRSLRVHLSSVTTIRITSKIGRYGLE